MGKVVKHKYKNQGNYNITLKVSDNKGIHCSENIDKLKAIVNKRSK